mmetsp:Transcript_29104/g.79887  ORF Transcript_29104/g.79887 Transcript_29104/m.79887 type:complete len:200 (-) Transcript_29104:1078-1677(-)
MGLGHLIDCFTVIGVISGIVADSVSVTIVQRVNLSRRFTIEVNEQNRQNNDKGNGSSSPTQKGGNKEYRQNGAQCSTNQTTPHLTRVDLAWPINNQNRTGLGTATVKLFQVPSGVRDEYFTVEDILNVELTFRGLVLGEELAARSIVRFSIFDHEARVQTDAFVHKLVIRHIRLVVGFIDPRQGIGPFEVECAIAHRRI